MVTSILNFMLKTLNQTYVMALYSSHNMWIAISRRYKFTESKWAIIPLISDAQFLDFKIFIFYFFRLLMVWTSQKLAALPEEEGLACGPKSNPSWRPLAVWLIDSWIVWATPGPWCPPGRTPPTEQMINSLKVLMNQQKRVSVRDGWGQQLGDVHCREPEDCQGPSALITLQTLILIGDCVSIF